MADDPLINKYRPRDWGEFVGNTSSIVSLTRVLQSQNRPHAYLFTGPAGIGKTSSARIIASALSLDITEIDAATNSGIDAMRSLVEFGQYMSLSGSEGGRLIIIDECHALSKPAWQAILKLIEEPPTHLYIALCTTERSKVPETVVTRCFDTDYKPISAPEMEDLLAAIADAEGWNVDKDVLALAVQAGTGQPRKAISILQKIWDAPTRDEARRIVSLAEASDPLIELLQHLISGKRSWAQVRVLLARLDDQDMEQQIIGAGRYICSAMMRTPEDKTAARIWELLEALVFPADTWDKKTSFIAAVGRMMWGQR